ncbi:MAG: hypothetical protein U0821_09630 [Chloroflexota bacterium]
MDFSQIQVSSNWVTYALIGIGVVLALLALVAWYRSNRAEAQPSREQQQHIREFLERDFAPYVARGFRLTGESVRAISEDRGWQRVFLHRLAIHADLNGLDAGPCLGIFREHVDAAVKRQLEASSRLG